MQFHVVDRCPSVLQSALPPPPFFPPLPPSVSCSILGQRLRSYESVRYVVRYRGSGRGFVRSSLCHVSSKVMRSVVTIYVNSRRPSVLCLFFRKSVLGRRLRLFCSFLSCPSSLSMVIIDVRLSRGSGRDWRREALSESETSFSFSSFFFLVKSVSPFFSEPGHR